ncbi:hypothetical protein NKH47_08145 [Mesorhizobium sp. M1060]|uniref:hypothetical protein n=1 Tax=Mesorhizobium sp. M1060 TaxID=2957052 RepID=UPI0033358020
MQWANIQITTAGGATKAGSVRLEPGSAGGSTCIAFSNEHWISASDLRQRIARSQLPVSLEILRGASQKVLPGDQIDVAMRYQAGPGAGAENPDNAPKVQQNSHSSAVLDNSGVIQVDAPGPLEPLPSATDPRGRVARALGTNVELSARLWQPGACSAAQPSLNDVSVCLAGSWSPSDDPKRAKYCALKLGIDGLQRNAAQANTDWLNASYHLQAAQSWTLVGDDGVVHAQPYTGAISVGKAVALGYRALYGRDLLRTRFQLHRAFITVVPDANRCSAERAPLSGVSELNKASVLDNTALLPGDAVHVRYSSPVR